MWTFEDASYLEHAAVGLDLEPNNHPRRIVASVAGPKNTKAVRIGTNTYYSVEHSISPNGRGATGLPAERVNEYTLMMDIMVPTGAADRIVLFNPKANNTTDGVLWLNKERQIGSGDLGGFSNSVLAPNIWHRVVVAAKLDEPSLNVYLNGERIWSANTASLTFDGTLSLLPKLHFGYDREGNGYPCPQYAEVRTWSVRLSDAQIRTLGTP
jgi:hypothetical protein